MTADSSQRSNRGVLLGWAMVVLVGLGCGAVTVTLVVKELIAHV